MGTKYKGTKKEIVALNSFIKLTRAADSVRSRAIRFLNESGITESQFYVLDAIYHYGSLNQKEIGEKVFRSGGNITLVIDNLEKQDLVKRVRGKEDRRFFTIHLTKAGKNQMDKLFPKFLSAVVYEMKSLNEADQVKLQKYCKMIGLKKDKI
jgi:MarR family 2-MHQ and catechol resistance regulon transcriptional repressor